MPSELHVHPSYTTQCRAQSQIPTETFFIFHLKIQIIRNRTIANDELMAFPIPPVSLHWLCFAVLQLLSQLLSRRKILCCCAHLYPHVAEDRLVLRERVIRQIVPSRLAYVKTGKGRVV
jgi:hypothetical protein